MVLVRCNHQWLCIIFPIRSGVLIDQKLSAELDDPNRYNPSGLHLSFYIMKASLHVCRYNYYEVDLVPLHF